MNTDINKLAQIPSNIDKATEYLEFCKWASTPKELREPAEQQELAKKLKVDPATLSIWKQTPEFEDNRRKFIYKWLGDDLPDIMQIVKRHTLRGSSQHTKILLSWLGELAPNGTFIDARTQNNTQINYSYTPEEELLIKEQEVKDCNDMLAKGELTYTDNKLSFTGEKQ